MSSIGLQLSSVRELLASDLPGTLKQIVQIGYRNVETSADLPEKLPPARLRALLDAAGLRSPVGLYRYAFLQEDLPRVIDAARTLGHEYVGLPSLGTAPHTTREHYQSAARQLNQWGVRLREAGLRLTYHNHATEFRTLGGEFPVYDLLLEQTDPDLVAFELDLYWIEKAGFDAVQYLTRFPGRFPLFHLRDSTPAPEKAYAAVGAGVIDFRRILSRAETAGLRYSFVETVSPENELEGIRSSYAALAAMLPRG